MKASVKIFTILGTFFAIVAAAYGIVTGLYEPLGIEPAGFPALIALAGLGFLIAGALRAADRKNPTQPEDDLDGELEDHAGVQGSFSPGSWAPLWTALGAGMCFLGVAAGWWIAAGGIIIAMYGVVLWVMEFSIGQHAH